MNFTPAFLALFLATILVCSAAGKTKEVHQTLTPENGLDRGSWGPVDLCPDGTTVNSFEFKYSGLGTVDDIAGNGIKLYCKDSTGAVNSYVTSTEGLYGDWQGIRQCSATNTFLTGVRLEVLPDQGTFHDDLGVTNVQFLCNTTGEVLTGNTGFNEMKLQKSLPKAQELSREFIERNGRKYEKIRMTRPTQPRAGDTPYYGSWLTCTTGYTICGLQTNVEAENAIDDDAGLCDAIFFCC